mmetsp:Transcript_6883/g.15691  ORF Transcript_6883/g.15691 Transcript_6883/m.15691 type:complete len:647 (+) Transcript_6883:1059-2999(+)
MLVCDDLQQLFPESLDTFGLAWCGLHVQHAHGDDGSLSDEVGSVGHQRLEEGVGVSLGAAGAGDAQGHRCRVSDVRIVTLREQLDDSWQLLGAVAEDEAESHDRSTSDVVVHIRDGDVQQLLDGRILGGANVSQSDAEAGSIAEDGVLVQEHLVDEAVSLLLAPEHRHRQSQRAASDDLLVLRVMGVGEELTDNFLRGGSYHHQADRVGCGLSGDSGIGVHGSLQLLIDSLVGCGHTDEAQAEAGSVLKHLSGAGVVELVQKVSLGLLIVVIRMDDAHCVQSSALRVGAAAEAAIARGKVGAEDGLRLLDVALVDDAEGGCCTEFSPVGGLGEPVQVLSQEDIAGGAALHEAMRDDCAIVGHRILGVDGGFDGLEEKEIRAVVAVEELEVKIDRSPTTENLSKLLEVLLVLIRHGLSTLGAVDLHWGGGRLALCRSFRGGRGSRRGGLLDGEEGRRQKHVAEVLVLVVYDVKGHLVGHEAACLVVAIHEILEDAGNFLRLAQKEVALADRGVVDVFLRRGIDVHELLEHLLTEGFQCHDREGSGLAILQHVGDVVAGHDESFDHVEPTSFERHAQSLLVGLVLHASVEHALHDILEPRVDGLAFLLADLCSLKIFGPGLDVLVDGYGDYLLDVLRSLGQVKEVACT